MLDVLSLVVVLVVVVVFFMIKYPQHQHKGEKVCS